VKSEENKGNRGFFSKHGDGKLSSALQGEQSTQGIREGRLPIFLKIEKGRRKRRKMRVLTKPFTTTVQKQRQFLLRRGHTNHLCPVSTLISGKGGIGKERRLEKSGSN